MTQLKDLEILYNQFIGLTKEINLMIENEDYESAAAAVKDKSKLIKKLMQAKKTTDLTAEQKQKFDLLEQNIRDDYEKNISSLLKIQEEVGFELIKIKKKSKLGSVYAMQEDSNSGQLIDYTE